MNCDQCSQPTTVGRGDYDDETFSKRHGTVYLKNIEVRTCSNCGVKTPIYPSLNQLAALVRAVPTGEKAVFRVQENPDRWEREVEEAV